MHYRREIDGLRALAVLAVIFFHAGFATFSGGYVGVDVFFVISGYLITAIILTEQQAGRFSLLNFYERRMRRILPALFLVLATCIPFALLWLSPSEMRDFSQSEFAVATFTSNFLFWHESGYFETDAVLKPLLHTWSLAVEEQFYVFYPLLLMLIGRFDKRCNLVILAALALVSLALSQWSAYSMPQAAFYLIPSRGWELLIGALIAFSFLSAGGTWQQRHFSNGLSQLGSLIGLLLILFSVLTFTQTTTFPGFNALVPTLGTALIIVFANPATVVGFILGSRVLVGLGLVSYSAYLWHQPLFAFARKLGLIDSDSVGFMALSVLAIVLAYVSWRFVERPFRRNLTINSKSVVVFAVLGSVLFMAFGASGHFANGFIMLKANDAQRAVLKTALSSPKNSACHQYANHVRMPEAACEYFFSEPSWAIFGDSHAVELAYALAGELRNHKQGLKHYSFSACTPTFGRKNMENDACATWSEAAVGYIVNNPAITHVVVTYRINARLFGEHVRVYPDLPDAGNDIYRAEIWLAYVNLLKHFVQAGKKVTLVLQAPEVPKRIDELIWRDEDSPENIDGVNRSWWNQRSAYVQSRLDQIPDQVLVIDPASLFCDQEICSAVSKGVAWYYDDHHMSVFAASRVADEILRLNK